jgi:glutaminyl-peptide cyclotransferase
MFTGPRPSKLMRLPALAVLALAAGVPCASQAPAFDGGRAFEHVRQLVSIGPRTPGSPGIQQARRYIASQLEPAGIKVTEQVFEAQTPLGRIHMVNVIATLPGKTPEKLVIGGHYDTKVFKEFRFVGANDGGSSTAVLIELARSLAELPRTMTMDVVFFDGEEAFIDWYTDNDNTYGSRHYIEAARKAGSLDRVKGMVLVDMVGDRNLQIRREQASTPWMSDMIFQSAGRLGLGAFFRDEPAGLIEDDHIPFLKAGIPAVNIIHSSPPGGFPAYWHTAGDTLDKISARSMEAVGRVVLDSIPRIEARLLKKTGTSSPEVP